MQPVQPAAGTPSKPPAPKEQSSLEIPASKGIVRGVKPGDLAPSKKATRAEFATMVLRITGMPKTFPEIPGFKDVPRWAWYYPIVEAAARAGYMKGNGDGSFNPDGVITGAMAAKVLANLGVEPKDSTLASKGALTRAQAAAALLEVYNSRDKLILSNYAVGPETCATCHQDKMNAWLTTGHSRHVRDLSQPGATEANFAANPAINARDLKLAIGGLTKQYFVDKNWKYIGYSWNQEKKQWEDASSVKGADYLDRCAGCHSVGYDKAARTVVSFNISCESCHGVGAKHVAGGGDKSQIKVSLSNDVCGSCHGGQKAELESMGHTTHFSNLLDTPSYKDTCTPLGHGDNRHQAGEDAAYPGRLPHRRPEGRPAGHHLHGVPQSAQEDQRAPAQETAGRALHPVPHG